MKKDQELMSLNEGLWSIDFEDVSVEALERRFELSVALILAEDTCGVRCDSNVCSSVCEPVCTKIIAQPA